MKTPLRLAGNSFWFPWLTLLLGGAMIGFSPLSGNSAEPIRTIPELLDLAWDGNERLRSLGEETQAARSDIQADRIWPDPMVELKAFGQSMDKEFELMLRQPLPRPGDRRTRESRAQSLAEAAHWRENAGRWEVAAAVLDQTATLLVRRERENILAEDLELLELIIAAGEGQVGTGNVSPAELLQWENERARVERRLASARAERAWQEQRLGYLLGLDEGRTVEMDLSAAVEAVRLPGDGEEPFDGDLSPAVRELASRVGAAERERDLARIRGRPELGVGLEYMRMSGREDEVAVIGSLSLPLWRENIRAGVRAGEARRRALSHALTDQRRELASVYAETLFRWEDGKRDEDLLAKEILPRSQAAVDQLEAAYRAGSADYTQLMLARRFLVEQTLELAEVRGERLRAAAALQEILGEPVFMGMPGGDEN